MPDHLHVLLFVQKPITDTLGHYIARWKIDVNKILGIDSVFEQGFNDQILHKNRSLKILIDYIRDNPRRLIVRKANPQFFRRVNEVEVGGLKFQAYGNLHLLDSPFKEQVIVHRAEQAEILRSKREQWLYTAANGGVLVSPFISPAEKAIRQDAEQVGSRFILITNEPMAERYKPASHDFRLGEEGRMLIISVNQPEKSLSRQTCLAMNRLAQAVCGSAD